MTNCIKSATMCEEVKVVSINGLYHARYIVDGIIKSEYTCKNKKEIGLMCREMLRWQHKLGNVTPFTTSARKRVNEKSESILGSSVRKVS